MSPGPWPQPGDRTAEEFRVRDPWRMVVRANVRFAPVLVVLFFAMTALGSLPFGGQLLPGLAVGAAVTGLLAVRLFAKARGGFASTVLRMSPVGVEWWDGHGFHVRLRWEDAVRVGEVRTALTRPGARVGVPGGVPLTVSSWPNSGLIGWGEIRVPPRVPDWLRDLVSRLPRGPAGAVEVAIPLGALDEQWAAGPMGGWVHRYRSDLV